MGQQRSCGKSTHHNSCRIGFTQLDPLLVTAVSFSFISDLYFFFFLCAYRLRSLINHDETYYNFSFVFSDAFVQCDSGTFPSRLLPPGSKQAQRQTNSTQVRETVIGLRPQVYLWGGATRRGSPGWWTSSSSSISCLLLLSSLLLYFKSIFICLLKPLITK